MSSRRLPSSPLSEDEFRLLALMRSYADYQTQSLVPAWLQEQLGFTLEQLRRAARSLAERGLVKFLEWSPRYIAHYPKEWPGGPVPMDLKVTEDGWDYLRPGQIPWAFPQRCILGACCRQLLRSCLGLPRPAGFPQPAPARHGNRPSTDAGRITAMVEQKPTLDYHRPNPPRKSWIWPAARFAIVSALILFVLAVLVFFLFLLTFI